MGTLSRRSMLRTAGSLAGAALATRPRVATAQGGVSPGTPTITLVGADYVRYMHIANGDVKPEGVTLRWIRGERTPMLRRVATDQSVDGGESSLAQHIMRIAAGDRSMVAIPIFPLRNFTARDAYMPAGSKLTASTLEGRRIGIYGWAASGAVWKRHMWERNPGVGRRLVDAFARADEIFNAIQRLYPYSSPWLIDDVEQADQHIGAKGYAPGMEANRHALEQFCEGAFLDGMTRRKVTVNEMFAEYLAT